MTPFSNVAILIALVQLCCASAALACSCANGPLKYSYKKAKIMFVGQAVHVQIGRQTQVVATFEVSERFRGNLGKTVAVHSDGNECSFHFLQGESYLVDAYRESPEDVVRVSLCSHTAAWDRGGKEKARLIRSRGWWWRLPVSYPGRYPIRRWYYRHF